jgi:hypothetical protein
MNEVPLGPARQTPGLDFVVWYRSKPKVPGDQYSPVWFGDERLNDSRYL